MVGGTVVEGTVTGEVLDVLVEVGGAELGPPHAAKAAPASTSIPMTTRCLILRVVFLTYWFLPNVVLRDMSTAK